MKLVVLVSLLCLASYALAAESRYDRNAWYTSGGVPGSRQYSNGEWTYRENYPDQHYRYASHMRRSRMKVAGLILLSTGFLVVALFFIPIYQGVVSLVSGAPPSDVSVAPETEQAIVTQAEALRTVYPNNIQKYFDQVVFHPLESQKGSCSSCSREFSDGQVVARLRCSPPGSKSDHLFCNRFDCIRFILSKVQCPVCKKKPAPSQ